MCYMHSVSSRLEAVGVSGGALLVSGPSCLEHIYIEPVLFHK
jgi:hypothetical protein